MSNRISTASTPVCRPPMPASALALALAAALVHALWNTSIAGDRDSQVASAVALGAGVLLIRGRGEVPARDIVLALGVGACIAGYTVVDKEGVRHADPLAYLELLLIFPAVAYLAIMRRLRGRALLRAELGVRTA